MPSTVSPLRDWTPSSLHIMEETIGRRKNALATTLSRLRELHVEGQFYDVQLQIDSEIFKTQRSLLAAISEYFETMFRPTSAFVETNTNNNEPITLHGVDETAFREILHFMYTGDVRVTDSNVYQLLLMSDYLRLRSPCVEQECVRHILTRCQCHDPMPNAIELFSFACIKAKDAWLDIVIAHIYQHLRHYSGDAKFVEIPFESLNTLLKRRDYILPLPGTEQVILKIILRWVNHSRNERSCHRYELMKHINFSNISANFVFLFINEMEMFTDKVTALPGSTTSVVDLHLGLEKCKVEMETGIYGINTAEVLSKGTVTFEVKKSQIENHKFIFSEPYMISNLNWKIKIKRVQRFLAFFLVCEGPPNVSKWSCCAKVDLIIVSQKGKANNEVRKLNEHIFSPDCECWGSYNFLMWNIFVDPGKGYIKENSIIFQADVYVDVTLN